MRSVLAGVSRARFRVRLVFCLFLGLSDFGTAQFSGRFSANMNGDKHGPVTGTVVNAATGAPIPFALVQIGQDAKLTDQNGNFAFENLPYTNASIMAHKPGFFDEQEAGNTPTQPQMVSFSDKPTAVTLRLVPEAVLSGHVENPEGDPLEGLPVRLRGSQIVNGRRLLQQVAGGSTDEDGDFRIANLRPGTYYVSVGPNVRARPVESADSKQKFEVVPEEYYPGVRELSTATPMQLVAGQHAAIEFGMTRVPAYRVAGVLTGAPANSGGLAMLDSDGERVNIGVRFNGQANRFDAFPVPAGAYRLSFKGRDNDGQEYFADVPINVERDLSELRVSVQRAITVPVEFVTEFTKRNENAGVYGGGIRGGSVGGRIAPDTSAGSQRRNIMYAQLHLVSRKPPYQPHFPGSDQTHTDLAFRALEPGVYDVEINPNGMAQYVSSISCGGVDLLRDPLVIAEGSDPQPIQVVVRDDGASLEGSVAIPDGFRSANVLMIAENGRDPARPIYVNNLGKFNVQGLAPGTYEVLAFDRLDGIEYRNREVLNEYLSHAAHVTLSPEQQAQVTVDLIRTRE